VLAHFRYWCGKDLIFCATVYPETKGVPLEEMDAVFGEGESGFFLLFRFLENILLTSTLLNERCIAELQEEQLESELDDVRASLVPRGRRSGSGSYRPARSRTEDGDGNNHMEKMTLSWSWLARLFGGNRRHGNYEPIIANDV